MAHPEAKELKELTVEALNQKLSEVKQELDALGKLTKDKIQERAKIKPLRRTRARILTFLNQKAEAPEA